MFGLKLASKEVYLRVCTSKRLGHRTTVKGVEPGPGKVGVTTKLPMPVNASQLQSLLGAMSYCRKCLPQMATVTRRE